MAEQLMNISFVSDVEKYPCLYNYTLKEYSKKDVTEKAWSEVGKTVNLTALQAKEKWKNLRSVFVRNLKSLPSGSSKKRKYYLTEAMQFAKPYIKTAGTTSGNLPNVGLKVENTQETNQNALPASPSQSDSSFIQLEPLPTPSPQACSLPPPSPQSVSSQRSAWHKRKLSKADERYNYLKFKMSKTEDNFTSNNANKMFLLSLLPDLNSMSPTKIRSFKRQVMVLIEDIIGEHPSTSSHTPTLVQIPNTVQNTANSGQNSEDPETTMKNLR